MTFIDNEDTKMINSMFDIDRMLNSFLSVGLIEKITGNYSYDVYNMCNNASMAFGAYLKNMFEGSFESLEVVEGVFNMEGNHTWLVLNDEYIIDLTLAQFRSNAPKISWLDKNTEEYIEVKKYSFKDWVNKNI